MLDILLGKPDAKSPHELHYDEVEGIRRGPWKLVVRGEKRELYNLVSDIGEKTDLAKRRPAIVNGLGELLTDHAANLGEDTRPDGFVEPGTAKPLASDSAELRRLRDYLGLAETTAVGQ